MPVQYDPRNESRPSEVEKRRSQVSSDAVQINGRGSLYSGGEPLADVNYAADVIERSGPTDKITGPIGSGEGTFELVDEAAAFDPDDPNLILHLEDGRSFPVVIEEALEDDGYRFRVKTAEY